MSNTTEMNSVDDQILSQNNTSLTNKYGVYSVIFIIALIFYLNKLFLNHLNEIENGRLHHPPIKDKMHILLKHYTENYGYYFLIIMDVILYGLFAFAGYIAYTQDKDLLIFNVFLPKMLFLFCIRSFLIFFTELSSCIQTHHRTVLNPMTIDLFFSSHTFFFFGTLVYIKQFYKGLKKNTIVLLSLLYIMLILAAKEHYTIDCVSSFLIAYFMFQNYLKD